jgi:hypothetical protein
VRWRDRYSWIALTALLVVAAAFLWHETRGTTLWSDEWHWALYRRENDLGTFLEPHNEHLSLVPLALYRLLFATAGLTDYAPYRALGIGGHIVCVTLVFAYASRRVGSLPALLAAALILFLGPAWQNILWPFQVGSQISLAAGLGALLMLDRADRPGDAAACALLAVSIASSGLGIPIAAGVAVDVLWGRRRLRSAWIVAAPLAAYGLWWLVYQDSDFVRHNLVVAPGFAADSAAAALSAVSGLSGPTLDEQGETLGWGRPLAVAAAGLLVWRLARAGPVPARVFALLAIAVSFWFLTGLRRAGISTPYEGRYLYVGALFLVLVAVELARGFSPPRWAAWLMAAALGLAILANLGDLRDGGRFLRSQATSTRAELGALEIGRPLLEPGFVATRLPGYPFILIQAGPYFAAADSYGSPAASAAEIASAPESARQIADGELTLIHEVALTAGGPGARVGSRPAVDAVSGGDVTGRGGCVRFRPDGPRAAGVASELAFTLPSSGVLLTAGSAPATVAVRRFADGFPSEPLGTLAARGSATLRLRPDLADEPWHVRVASDRGVTACGLA